MKATELKIGDIVSFLGNPTKVHSIDPPAIYVIDKDDTVWGTNEINNDITPIPLTSEILEKNGWEEYIDKYGYTYYLHNGWYRLSMAEQKGSWIFSHYDDFLTTIQSVHQLQHLLWALGMDDDLKI